MAVATAISKAQSIVSKAKVVNIESQLTTEGVEKGLFCEDSKEVSEGSGDDEDDNGGNGI